MSERSDTTWPFYLTAPSIDYIINMLQKADFLVFQPRMSKQISKIKFLATITVLLIIISNLPAASARTFDIALKKAPVKGNDKKFVEGEVIIKYKNNKINLKTAAGRAAATRFSGSKFLEKKEELEKNNIQVFKIKDAKTVEEKVTELVSDPNVDSAQPNFQYSPTTINTDDPSRALLWGLDNTGQTINGSFGNITGTADSDIDAPEAWAISEATTTTPVIVAVIDTGVAYDHPDLAANMWDGANCKDDNGVDLGGCNHGYDYEDGDKTPLPTNSIHGTHVAGIIAAVKNNGKGVIGVAPRATIMAIKSSLTTDNIIKNINFATQNGAKIINASWGGTYNDPVLKDAIASFPGLFIAAAGNCGDASTYMYNGCTAQNQTFYPASYDLDNIISVAATDQNDALASFSNYALSSVDVGAPGTNIYSTVPSVNNSTLLNESFSGITDSAIPSGWVQTGSWGVRNMTSSWGPSWGKVLFSDLNSPYLNNASTTITIPAVNLGDASSGSIDFWTVCDTQYLTSGWADYMALEFSADGGNNFTEVLRWDEAELDSYNADSNPAGSAVYHFSNFEIPPQYLTSSFKFRFHWVTDASDNNYGGCAIDDLSVAKSVVSNGSDEQYTFEDGTSMAAPQVAGLAALVEGYNPVLSLSQVKNIILTSGDSVASLAGKTVSGKRINAQKALQAAAPVTLSSIAITTPATKLIYTVGDSLDLTGLAITGTYSDSTTAPIAVTTSSVSGFDSSVPVLGQILTIAVTGVTTTYSIDVLDLLGVTISDRPASFIDVTNTLFSFSSDYASSTFSCKLDNADFSGCEATTTQSYSGLAEGPHVFEVEATAALHHTATATADFTVDLTKPVITLVGSSTVNVAYGVGYPDEGAVATDTLSNIATSSLIVSGDSVTSTTATGTYHLYYDVSDAAGNHADQVVRTVIVSALEVTLATAPTPPAPVSSGGGGGGGGYSLPPSAPPVIPPVRTTTIPVAPTSTVTVAASAPPFATMNTVVPATSAKISRLEQLAGKLKLGNKSAEVMELQTELKKLGFLAKTFKPSKLYDSVTAAAVKKYLASLKKNITPVKTVPALSLLDTLISKTKFGQRGTIVKQLQVELNKVGFIPKPMITSYYGTLTKTAVSKYLASNKL